MTAKDAQSLAAPVPANPSAVPATATASEVPLCVDLDHTLIKTDCFWETAVRMLFRRPFQFFILVLGSWRGRAWLKRRIWETQKLSPDSLPYNSQVIDLIRQQKAAGRQILLVTASDQAAAEMVGAHLKLFDEVVGSDGKTNLIGSQKSAYLVQRFGLGGFDYAGDSAADIKVWSAARHAYAASPVPKARRWLARRGTAVTTVSERKSQWAALGRALRPQHWVKNILIFMPALAAHIWHSGDAWSRTFYFFVAFCFGASAAYLINDLADIESDRRHKDKWQRPLASGDLPISDAVAAIPLCIAVAACCCWMAGPKAFALLAGYFAATVAYSCFFKRVPVLDVIFLSGFYVYRISAGAYLAPIELSEWLVVFAMFLFLSLGAAKRYVELTTLAEPNRTNTARGYLPEDFPMIAAFGVNCSCLAVLVLGLYINSDKFHQYYSRPALFWMLCPLLLYWLIRVWLLAGRRKLREDPVIFALKDPPTWLVAALSGVVFLIAVLGNSR